MATLFSLNDGNLTDSNVFGQTMSSADLFDGVSNLNVTTSYSNPSINVYSITSDGSTLSAVAVNINYRATNPTGTVSMLLSSGASYVTETYAISSFTPYDDRNNLVSTTSQNWQILKLTTPFSSSPGDKIRLDFKTSDDYQLALVGILTAYESTKKTIGTFDGTFTQSDSPFAGSPQETSYKFSSSKANFSGYGDAVFGTGDFTIELWFKLNTVSSYTPFIMKGTGYSSGGYTNDWAIFYRTGEGIRFSRYSDVTTDKYFNYVPTTNTWTHLALCRKNNQLTLFINGSAVSTQSDTTNYYNNISGVIQLGSGFIGGSWQYLDGYITNARVVTDKALYTGNFTVPTSPLTLASGFTYQNYKSPTSPIYISDITPFTGVNAEDGSLYFNGTSDYLISRNNVTLNLSASNFTIEFWLYVLSLPNAYKRILGYQNGSAATSNYQYYIQINPSNKLEFGVGVGETFYNITTPSVISTNTWVHYAYIKDGTNSSLYIDGLSAGGRIVPATLNSVAGASLYIGADLDGSYKLNGYISNARISNTNIYSNNFTPSIAPLSATANTLLLLKAPYNPLTYNNTTILSSASPFGVGTDSSIKFNGTSDYLNLGNFLQFPLTGDFTVEFWLNFPSNPSVWYVLIDTWEGSGAGGGNSQIEINPSGNLTFYYDGNNTMTGNTTITTNAWHHVAVVRSNNLIRFYIDGILDTATPVSFSGNVFKNSYQFNIGRQTNGNTWYYNGCLSNIRIVKGTALYTQNFNTSAPISPLTPLSAIAGTVFLMKDAYDTRFSSPYTTPFLLGSYGDLNKGLVTTNTKPAYYDILSTGTLTKNGTPTLSTASPFGVGTDSSIYCDKDNNVQLNASTDFGFGTDDFTIECWVHPTASDSNAIFTLNEYDTGILYSIYRDDWLYINGTRLGYLNNKPAVTLNAWTHVAFVRKAGVINIYYNGVSRYTTSTVFDLGTSKSLKIGARYSGAQESLKGFISNFRVVKGRAVYNGNFSPPTSPLNEIYSTTLLYKDPYGTSYTKNIATLNNIHIGGALNGLTSESRVLTASTVDVGDLHIHNQGKLVFPTNTSKTLTLEGSKGMQITSDGTLEIGTASNPISSTVQHNIILSNSQIDVHNGGNMNVYGAYKKPYTYLTADSLSATKSFTVVDSVSTSWLSGDSVVFTPNTYQRTSFDVLTLSSFDSGTTFKTTTNAVYNHPSVTSLGNVPTVSNLSRNVSIKGSLSSSRATVRAVDAAKVNIANTQFINFGIASANKNGFVIGTNSSGYVSLSGNSFYSDGYSGTTHITTASGRSVLGNLTLKDNTFFKSGGYGISLSSVSATGLTVTGNNVLSANNSGLYFASVSSSGANMNNNTVIGSKSYGTFVVNCTIDGDFGGAINYGNGNRGLVLSADHIGNLNNLISLYNTNEGIYIDGAMPGLSSTIFSNITSNNNTSTGIEVSGNDVNASTPIVLNMRDIVAKNNDGIGFEMYNISGNISSVYLDNNLNYGMKSSIGGETTIDGLSSFLVAGLSAGTLTKNGTPTLSTASPFGVGTDSSVYCNKDNNVQLNASTDFGFSTGDFTIECWVHPTASDSNTIFTLNEYDTGILFSIYRDDWLYINGSQLGFSTNKPAVTLNAWTHVAFVRKAGVINIYYNGVSRYTTSTVFDLGTSKSLKIGARYVSGFESLKGFVSNFRVVKGTAVYTANFTPSTSPLSVIGGTALLYQAPYGTSYNYVAYRGSSAINLGLIGGNSYYPINIKNSNIASTTSSYYGTPLLLDSTNYKQFNVENTTLSSNINAVTLTSTTDKVRGSYMFSKCMVGSSPVAGNSNYQSDVFKTTGVAFMNKNNVDNSNSTHFAAGDRSLDNAIFINAESSPSERLKPSSSTLKLRSGSKFVALNAGESVVVKVLVRKSSIADGAVYNGKSPRLILKRNANMGIPQDVLMGQLDTVGDFLPIIAQTPVVTDTGVLEFYVDCDGTQGFINVDSWDAV